MLQKRVVVIGAGAAGLAACRELQRQNLEPLVFEQDSVIGGQWVYYVRQSSASQTTVLSFVLLSG